MAVAVLAAISVATAAGILWVVARTSDQRGIIEAKRGIRAGLFEIRLFNDDLRAILRAQRDILRHNVRYLRHSLVPMAWVLLPLAVLAAQLQFFYGYQAVRPGESALVTARFAAPPSTAVLRDLSLHAPSGVRVDTAPVWIPSLNEATWRITAERPGAYELRLGVGGESVSKTLRVDGGLSRLSPSRLEEGLMNRLLRSAERPLPDPGGLRSVSVSYPTRWLHVFGWRLHWLALFGGLTLVAALALRRPFKVVF